MATLVSTLCNYLSSGKVKRPAPSTYFLVNYRITGDPWAFLSVWLALFASEFVRGHWAF